MRRVHWRGRCAWRANAAISGATCVTAARLRHRVRLGAGAYICGEETSMLESLEGRRGEVRVRPPLPAIKGLFGQPTVVNNVVTLATVPVILARGAAFYRDFGMGKSRGTVPLQLAGNVKHGGLVERAFGLTVNQLVYDYGGGTATGRPVRAVQIGGPLGAYLPPSRVRHAARLRSAGGQGRRCWATAAWWCSMTPSTWRAWRGTRSSSAPSNPAASARRAASVRRAASNWSIGSWRAPMAAAPAISRCSTSSATPWPTARCADSAA